MYRTAAVEAVVYERSSSVYIIFSTLLVAATRKNRREKTDANARAVLDSAGGVTIEYFL